ncbi:Uroporphyrin-III C-methyltransferase [Moelleriella libera RCEF 2490]|uniref:precorrin-2 dehydrogenase n=1 Tax=Moelleriella libera RCEF 2490 TaxID=1081109 RepID=A0A168DFH3_9HYPO|nr:Uroporphyrin-III C-methyltransferase [Moelleriella libera RCEF 2490]
MAADHNALLVGIHARANVHLIIGTNPLASARCTQSLAAGALPVLIAPSTADLHYNLQSKITDGLVTWKQTVFEDEHLFTLGRPEVDSVVDAVFVTSGPRDPLSVHISQLCQKNRIPVNVVDAPHLCTFAMLSTYTDGPLQIGITTNGRGCKLASRIRREITSALPRNLGAACARLGQMRRKIQEDDAEALGDLDDSVDQGALFNKLVAEEDVRNRRMRWLSQMCEYWPLGRLANTTDDDVDKLLTAYPGLGAESSTGSSSDKLASPRLGKVILAGSGPGHPDLLTTATLKAIQTADLILADKLVPSGVLDLIPRRTPVQIARKFPGNADKAQEELLEAALQGVQAGQTVLRLKQGDPFIYGRGGEEIAFFNSRSLGSRVTVLPGVTSALSASLFASIPATQRDVADQVLICTGTGKKGKPPNPPPYVPSQTVVFLMALHRINGLVAELTTHLEPPFSPETESAITAPVAAGGPQTGEKCIRALFPIKTPCAVIERASCPDQRVIRTTLQHVAEAIEAEGSRPPGLLVVGRACEVLFAPEKGRAWVVQDGFRGLDADDTMQEKWMAGLQAAMA